MWLVLVESHAAPSGVVWGSANEIDVIESISGRVTGVRRIVGRIKALLVSLQLLTLLLPDSPAEIEDLAFQFADSALHSGPSFVFELVYGVVVAAAAARVALSDAIAFFLETKIFVL